MRVLLGSMDSSQDKSKGNRGRVYGVDGFGANKVCKKSNRRTLLRLKRLDPHEGLTLRETVGQFVEIWEYSSYEMVCISRIHLHQSFDSMRSFLS